MTLLQPTKTVNNTTYFNSPKRGKFSIEKTKKDTYVFEAEKSLYKVLKGLGVRINNENKLEVYE